MTENIQDKAVAAVRQVIGAGKVHQVSAFDDSQGRSVTVRYEGVTDTKAAQVEAVRVLMALKNAGFEDYPVSLFVTDDEKRNVGSMEVKPPYFGVITFETVGNKWRGTMPKDTEFKPDVERTGIFIDEVAPIPWDYVKRLSGVFRKFYGEKRIDDGIALTPQPEDEPDAE